MKVDGSKVTQQVQLWSRARTVRAARATSSATTPPTFSDDRDARECRPFPSGVQQGRANLLSDRTWVPKKSHVGNLRAPPTVRSHLDARQIIGLSVAATERNWQAKDRYTYLEFDESRRLDSSGRVKSQDVDVSRIISVNGVPFEQLVEHNGRPLSAEEQMKQEEKIEKQKHETAEERAARLEKEQENRSFIREVPAVFDFRLVGEDVVNGRPAFVLQATPRPGYQAHGKYGKIFSRVEGKLWVDKQDLAWIKVDGQVIQPISMGLFLARVLRGSHIVMEQTRVGEGIWEPERIEVRASAKMFFVKSLVIDKILTYSDYRLAQTGALVTADRGCRIYILVREEQAGQHRIIANRHVIRSHSLDSGGPVVTPVHHLHTATHRRSNGCHGWTLRRDRLGVILSERRHGAGA
jgi:hypothetical protein